METIRRWLSPVLHAQGTQNSKGDIVNNDNDYSLVDEVVHYGTIIFLIVMTITFLGVIAGFLWGML
jgi:phosphatidylglycerophosphatase A